MSSKSTQRLFELMNEIDEILDEMTTTGDAAGFDTPNAFSSMAPGAEKHRKNNGAVLGYTLVADPSDTDDTDGTTN
jgi:hypothetical protein